MFTSVKVTHRILYTLLRTRCTLFFLYNDALEKKLGHRGCRHNFSSFVVSGLRNVMLTKNDADCRGVTARSATVNSKKGETLPVGDDRGIFANLIYSRTIRATRSLYNYSTTAP